MSRAVEVIHRRTCDLGPTAGHPPREATVDGKTTFGPWANMCDDCHRAFGVGLGTGRGQRLVYKVPS